MTLPKHYLCYRAAHPFPLDGKLNKPVWQAAPWTDDFEDIEGHVKPRPRFRTRAKMLWDDDNLYIGAEMQEPCVWATLTQHDSVIFQDNDFEVFLDPDGDNHDYYEIEINALNTTWDLRLVKPYRDGGPALNEWEIPGFRSAVHVDGVLNDPRHTDKEWSLEMAPPWNALGNMRVVPVRRVTGDRWRINFSRVEWDVDVVGGKVHKVPNRPEHNWVWSPQGVVDMHRPEKWGFVQFSTAPPATARYVPDPSLPARDLLMEIYYAQKAFHARNTRWAASLPQLQLSLPHLPALPAAPTLQLTPQGYTATCPLRLPDGTTQNWHVREDSRLWTD